MDHARGIDSRRKGFVTIVLTLIVGASISCGPPTSNENADVPDPAAGRWDIDRSRVLYERRTPAGTVLYVFDRGTGQSTAVTAEGGRNWSARPSPDGTRIAFVSLRDGNYEMYVRQIGHADATNLTAHPDYDLVGAWSPDGAQIAFMSTRGYELGGADGPFPGHIYVLDARGGEPRRVTREPLTSSLGPSDWSPDGGTLLIGREIDGQIDIFELDAQTGDERRLTDDPASEFSAAYSHDGSGIAYHASTDAGSRIVVMGADGSGRRFLTDGGHDYGPRWSPDDEWLLVTRRGEGSPEQYDVVAIRVSDGSVQPLVTTEADERANDWMPDGS